MRSMLRAAFAGLCFVLTGVPAQAQTAATERLYLVFVVDGLRPDSITRDDTPNLFRLREEGVFYINGHAVFPTVTRANATALATGTYPGKNGVLGNTQYVSEVDAAHAFSNDDHKNLLKLDAATGGQMVLVPSLAEILAARGLRFAVVSSGSTGSALLLNPKASSGVGVDVNQDFTPGSVVAFPATVNAEIIRRFGTGPAKGGARDAFDANVEWAERVLAEYVIPELRPNVVVNWLTEPDHTQHAFGAGSPEARSVIQNSDRQIGVVLQKLSALGMMDRTDIFVVSDHGFGYDSYGVDITGELIKAGLKAGPDSSDVVVASSGYSVLLHVQNRERERIARIVAFLQQQPWIGVTFTAGAGEATHEGMVPGTFSLELIHMQNARRGPDIVFTFPWSSALNPFGVPGIDTAVAGATGPLTRGSANHGSMSPWNVRNTFLLWGADFKRRTVVRVPASNVDVTPTILALLGIEDVPGLDGRVLREALKDGPDEEQVAIETRTLTTGSNGYKAALQITTVGEQRYIDKSWRVAP
jgi:predicted AlkP superfamily pyrophosphatase or phosphodiesterase